MIDKIIKQIKPINKDFIDKAQERLDNLTKPKGSLGKLEDLAKRIVAIKQDLSPRIEKKVIFTLAGDHGVVEEKISAYPKEVTAQMVYNFLAGGAGINVLADFIGARVIVVDVGVATKLKAPCLAGSPHGGAVGRQESSKLKIFKDKKIGFGTKNMAKGPAMSREEAIKSIEAGIEVFLEEFENGIDIIGIGDMGIGNTTPSSAIIACLSGLDIEKVTGRGTGIDDGIYERKKEVIKKALDINRPDTKDPIDILAKVGGFEIGGICGIALAAASRKVPIILDGFISTAGALLAFELCPTAGDYMIPSHCSVEIGHSAMLKRMKLNPLLDLNLRLGEGTGAALGINLVEASIRILTKMATFEEANVSKKQK